MPLDRRHSLNSPKSVPGSSAARRKMFGSQKQSSEEVLEVLDVEHSMDGDRQLFLVFVPHPVGPEPEDDDPNNDDFSAAAYSEFKKEDCALDRALLAANQIRLRHGFREGLLLKCIEPKPMFSFLHLATFDTGAFDGCTPTVVDTIDLTPGSLVGAYDELFAIQKSSTFIEPALPSHRHAGYIVSSFKILDTTCRQKQLEKTWLSWTGAREIYKYSPRTWNLRRITLMRVAPMSRDNSRTFAYVVLCEFGNILHPANTIQALDMCERLRARNCGHIGLYQVQYNYARGQPVPAHLARGGGSPSGSWSSSLGGGHGGGAAGASPRSSPRLSPRPGPAHGASRLAQPGLVRGYSQDVASSRANNGVPPPPPNAASAASASRRRSDLQRMRDRSLGGYDLNEAQRFHSYQFEEMS